MKSQTGGAVMPQRAEELIATKWARKKAALMSLQFDGIISQEDYNRMADIVDKDYYEDERKLNS